MRKWIAICLALGLIGSFLFVPIATAAPGLSQAPSNIGEIESISLGEKAVDLIEGEDVQGENSKVHLDNGTCRFEVDGNHWIEISLTESRESL